MGVEESLQATHAGFKVLQDWQVGRVVLEVLAMKR